MPMAIRFLPFLNENEARLETITWNHNLRPKLETSTWNQKHQQKFESLWSNTAIIEQHMTIDYSEKRDFIRMTANSQMTYQESGSTKSYQGYCINLSAAGILFETDHLLEPGTLVQIKITPELAIVKPLIATIKVLRTVKNTDGKFAIAAEIKDII